jgi:predicted RNA binding protein YcfA (HicA-like mRNA interferase family)
MKTKLWIKFLTEQGCERKRVKGSHFQYKCPNCLRPIPVREKDKEVPLFHIQTGLKTLGLSKKDLKEWLKNEKNLGK